MEHLKLFHISENPAIKIFEPRPSPSFFESIKRDVVFAVSENRLHNYLLPRECPRVAFFAKADSTEHDREKFIGKTTAEFIIALESNWLEKIKQTILYCYQFPIDDFILIDEGAGYYVSYKTVLPISVTPIVDVLESLLKRNVEVRFISNLKGFGDEISKSSLQYSLIRMRNAIASE